MDRRVTHDDDRGMAFARRRAKGKTADQRADRAAFLPSSPGLTRGSTRAPIVVPRSDYGFCGGQMDRRVKHDNDRGKKGHADDRGMAFARRRAKGKTADQRADRAAFLPSSPGLTRGSIFQLHRPS